MVDEQAIRATNYWDGPFARSGMYVLSCDAEAVQLFVPSGRRHQIDLDEMRTGRRVVLTRQEDSLELTFDDGTKRPFRITLHLGQVDHPPELADNGRDDFVFSAWVKGPKLALRLPLTYHDQRRHASYRPGQPR